MSIDDLFKDLLKLFLSYKEIDLGLKELLGVVSVNISEVLRKDLIEVESSECGGDDTGYHLSAGCLLGHADLDLAVKGNVTVLISKNGFAHILVNISFAGLSVSLLSQIVDTQDHIL